MMPNHWSLTKQDGSQEQHLCPLRLERNRVVCRCFCCKKSCGLQMFLLQEIVWSADVLVARKKACRPEVISRYLACCSSLVCIAEFFVNFVEGDDSP